MKRGLKLCARGHPVALEAASLAPGESSVLEAALSACSRNRLGALCWRLPCQLLGGAQHWRPLAPGESLALKAKLSSSAGRLGVEEAARLTV